MRRFLISLLFFTLFIGFAPSITVAQTKAIKIGVIDTERIMRDSKPAKEARAIILKDLEVKRALYKAKEDEVRAMQEEVRKGGKDMPQPVMKGKVEGIEKEIKELSRLKSDLEEDLKKKDAALAGQILADVGKIVKDLSLKEKYTLILEKKSVVTSDDAIDITDKIITIYDAQKK